MKKLLFCFLSIIAMYGIKAQYNCATAQIIVTDSLYTVTTSTENWFSFTATDTNQSFQFYSGVSGGNLLPQFFGLKHTCHTAFMLEDSLNNWVFDNSVIISNLNIGSTYYIRFVNAVPNSTFRIRLRNLPDVLGEPCITTPPNCEHVCNGGFEDISAQYPIPVTSPEDVYIFNGWDNPGPALNNPTGNTEAYWFNGNIGNQLPYITAISATPYGHNSSYGLIGLVTYVSSASGILGYREYAQTKLNKPMMFGRFYYAEMHVRHFEESRYFSNQIGMYFSSTPIKQPGFFSAWNIPATPQIETGATIGNNWTNVSGIVTNPSTSAPLMYLTLGNFRDDSYSLDNGQILPVVNSNAYRLNNLAAYYLIDNVSVIELPWAGPNKSVCTGEIVSIGEACALPTGITVQWFGPNTNQLSTQIPYTFTATTSGVYTLQVTYKGHTYTDNVTVNVDCCTKPNMDYTFMYPQNASIGFSTEPKVSNVRMVNGKDIVVNKQFALDESVTFTDCHFYMGPDAELRVVGNVTATFTNCILESCDDVNMWKGIRVLFNNSTLVMNSTTIREVEAGIEINNGGTVTLESSVFENNYRGIHIKSFNGPVPLSVTKTTFVTNSTLLHPHTGITRGLAGIDLENVGFASIGALSWEPADINSFTNFDYGIRAIKSGVDVNYNRFTNNFYGVYADAQFNNTGMLRIVNVGHTSPERGNEFVNNVFGAVHRRGAYGTCAFNIFTNNQVAHRMYNQPNGAQFAIEYNILQNNSYGFWASECVKPQFLIDNNDFNLDVPVSPNGYAILLENVVQPSTDWIPTPPPSWRNSVSISNNVIKHYENGIQVTNIAAPDVWRNDISGIPAYWSTPTHGIRLYNCPKAEILDNRAVGTSSTLWAGHGIAIDFAVNNLIKGNCVKNLGRGIWVGGQSHGVKVRSNTMENCNTGFFANWAFIGTQGWPLYDPQSQTGVLLPSDNEWKGTTSNHLYNFQPLLSNGNEFVLRSSGSIFFKQGHFPQSIISAKPAGASYNEINYYASTAIQNPDLYYGDSYCSIAGGYNFKVDTSANTIYTAEEVATMADTSSLNVWVPDDVARAWLRDQALYRELVQDTVNYTGNTVLSTFLGTAQQSELDEIENIDELIRLGLEDSTLQNLALAIALNNALSGSELPLQTTAQVNDLYLGALSDADMHYALSASEMATLYTVAQQCPYIYGTAVYQARSLLSLTDSLYAPTLTPCELGYQNGTAKTDMPPGDAEGKQVKLQIENNLKLFPNPANNRVMVMFSSSKYEQGKLKILSSSGQLVYQELITANQNTLISLPILPNGLYLCQVIADGEIISSEKLVISK